MFAELGKAPTQLLTQTDVPRNPNVGEDQTGLHYWHSLDSEKNYRKNPHPTFGAKDIEYRFNRHGYRGPELELAKDRDSDTVTVVCIGSSGLFGTGLPEEMSLPSLLGARLQEHLHRRVDSWNFGVGGTGPEYPTRMLFSVLPAMKPDIVVLSTHPFNRREFIGETGKIYTTQSFPHWHHRFTDPERYQMHVACRQISNPYNHVMQFLTNAKVWESLCDRAGVMWLFTTEGYSEHIESVYPFMNDPRKMVGPGMFPLTKKHRGTPETGLARDMLHPGIVPTRELADSLFERLCEVYPDGLGKLNRTTS